MSALRTYAGCAFAQYVLGGRRTTGLCKMSSIGETTGCLRDTLPYDTGLETNIQLYTGIKKNHLTGLHCELNKAIIRASNYPETSGVALPKLFVVGPDRWCGVNTCDRLLAKFVY